MTWGDFKKRIEEELKRQGVAPDAIDGAKVDYIDMAVDDPQDVDVFLDEKDNDFIITVH